MRSCRRRNNKIHMSYEKLGGRSYTEKKADSHWESWKEEMDQSVGRSSKELGIYNRQEVIGRLRELYETLPKTKEFEFLNSIKEVSADAGVYVVGGSVRDAVLEKPAKDIDLVVNRIEPLKLIGVLLKYGKVVFDRNPKARLETMDSEEMNRLITDAYGVIKFNPKDSSLPELIDVSFPRRDDHSESGHSRILGIKRDVQPKADPNLNISEELKRRDLTINAMAVNLMNGEIVDPFDGVEDIVKQKIQTVGNPEDRILKEDLSRGFRAIRFACIFSSEIEDRTKKAIKEVFRPAAQAPETIYRDNPEVLNQVRRYELEVRSLFGIPQGPLPRCLQVFWDREQQKPRMAVASEVMSKEILKSVNTNPKRFVELMDEVGGLSVVLPEFARLKNIAQPREFHREGDVFQHTLKLLDNLPQKASLRLKLAALLHDTGKADTQEISENGKITFHGHARRSADHARAIAQRFRLPGKLGKEIVWLVENHMLPISSDVKRIKSTKLEKIFLEDESLGKDSIALSRADALASIPEGGKPNLENINLLIGRIDQLKQLREEKEKAIPRLVTGKDLIELGLKPGRGFSQILDQIREAQLDGKINSKKEGIELVNKIIK